MPPLSSLPLFVVASLALLAIPGPAVLFIVARSGAQGTRAGLVSVLGVHVASALHVLAAAAGLSAIVVASSVAFTVVKVVGGLYLIGIGVKSLRGARSAVHSAEPSVRSERQIFTEAFIVNIFNPKVALFFLAFIPQFVDTAHGPVWSQTLVFGAAYIALGLCTDSLYAVIGARAGVWFNARSSRMRASRYAEGSILVGLGLLTLLLPHRNKVS
ncbi:MAG: LysE family translocator [Actinobacteria bacterium]|nr:LysE family translocator [Actinomycetota bacterium]